MWTLPRTQPWPFPREASACGPRSWDGVANPSQTRGEMGLWATFELAMWACQPLPQDIRDPLRAEAGEAGGRGRDQDQDQDQDQDRAVALWEPWL